MALYAIGDIQGCYDPFRELLDAIEFDPDRDRLWLCGDLVNRGPKSLKTLRFVKSLGTSATTVLGNHDLHLLACAAGGRTMKESDTLDQVLVARDCDELLDWLRMQPLLHIEGSRVLVHAGLYPEWSLEQAQEAAREVEEVLRADDWEDSLRNMYRGKVPRRWSADLPKPTRIRATVAVMTRMRTVTRNGRELNKKYSGPIDGAPIPWVPWFEVDAPNRPDTEVIFGHWAALGLHRVPGYSALDTGCVWGGCLTALRLDDGQVFQTPAIG